jgi:uncharacterized protein
MHYEGSFEVPSQRQKVYDFIVNPQKITGIFPDVSNVKIIDNDNFTLKAKVGMSFIRGTMDVKLTMVEKRPPEFAKLKARGSGISSSVDLESTFTLEDAKGGTLVKWAADAKVSGLMASVGSRLMDSAADKYVKQIIGSLQKSLS